MNKRDATKRAFLGRTSGVAITSDFEAGIADAQVLIDFTRPEGTLLHLDHAKSMVIGTTGFSEPQKRAIEQAARRIPIVMAASGPVSAAVHRTRPAEWVFRAVVSAHVAAIAERSTPPPRHTVHA